MDHCVHEDDEVELIVSEVDPLAMRQTLTEFEKSLELRRLELRAWFTRIKRYVQPEQRGTITSEQIQTSFGGLPKWKELCDKESDLH